jgi:hypothetical protein
VILENKTHWRTADLRRIAQRVCREEFPRERFGDRWRQMRLVVGYNRAGSGSSSGHAYYGGRTAYVNVPSGNVGKGNVGHVNPVDFAHVVAHEFGHCKGLRHGRMPPHMESTRWGQRSDYIRQHFAWAAALPIRKVEPKRKVRPAADEKLAHAERMLARAVTREKRAATLRKKWQAKVRYYGKVAQVTLGQAAQRKED